MKKKYYPILVSKRGEMVALQHLEQKVKDDVSPVIEVLKTTIVSNVKEKGEVVGTEYSDEFEERLKTHWSFFGNQVILDFSLFDNIPHEINRIKKLFLNLRNAGVNAIPAIQSNSQPVYKTFVKEIISKFNCAVCIRGSNNSGGLLVWGSNIKTICAELKISKDNVILLLDMGQIDESNYATAAFNTGSIIRTLPSPVKDWLDVCAASSSFPEVLSDDIKKLATGFKLKRFEKLFWDELMTAKDLRGIKYSDFGCKSSTFKDMPYSGTVSLKYTIEEDYLIFKGGLASKHKLAGRQFITHCKNLVKHPDYSGRDFSWGDLQYYEKSLLDENDDKSKPGSSEQRVQYGQNHHITLIHHILS